ncbi:hypothetical protein AIOGIFDO_01246 [Candidatus Methanoperedenaceae archaeon GB37]|nr:hypothetical protein AIOGIFDO_01246 [Candidatus Methanoperedenaceae archaeon GB37]
MNILTMRRVKVKKGDFMLTEKINVINEKKATPFGNSAKTDIPKKYNGQRTYVTYCTRLSESFVPKSRQMKVIKRRGSLCTQSGFYEKMKRMRSDE